MHALTMLAATLVGANITRLQWVGRILSSHLVGAQASALVDMTRMLLQHMFSPTPFMGPAISSLRQMATAKSPTHRAVTS